MEKFLCLLSVVISFFFMGMGVLMGSVWLWGCVPGFTLGAVCMIFGS